MLGVSGKWIQLPNLRFEFHYATRFYESGTSPYPRPQIKNWNDNNLEQFTEAKNGSTSISPAELCNGTYRESLPP